MLSCTALSCYAINSTIERPRCFIQEQIANFLLQKAVFCTFRTPLGFTLVSKDSRPAQSMPTHDVERVPVLQKLPRTYSQTPSLACTQAVKEGEGSREEPLPVA